MTFAGYGARSIQGPRALERFCWPCGGVGPLLWHGIPNNAGSFEMFWVSLARGQVVRLDGRFSIQQVTMSTAVYRTSTKCTDRDVVAHVEQGQQVQVEEVGLLGLVGRCGKEVKQLGRWPNPWRGLDESKGNLGKLGKGLRFWKQISNSKWW